MQKKKKIKYRYERFSFPFSNPINKTCRWLIIFKNDLKLRYSYLSEKKKYKICMKIFEIKML